ncbi:PVC-type heme-binding CxxCH protein [Humisphaera borealis]|uniref:HEAT repeat domain-containing protein n=1 Tax=Humisphaera borealis TaxID=2807512 RepID=A0A7M2X2A9_9BACT|nr:PVC-type heme-binding CxxCH protein [Humisphaera borealis]QOV91897.1 HEAT repeat domain-containing protein [Humisphaera borealis]
MNYRTVVLPLLSAIVALFGLALVSPLRAEDEPLGGKLEFREPKALPVKTDDGSAERAIAGFHVAPGLKVKLWAAEPMLSNPNALSVDEQGRVYVSEANRFKAGVIDVRSTMNWLEEDIAAKTVADRVAMVKKHAGEKSGREAIESTDPERIMLLQDTTGSGKADKYSVFSQGYNRIEDGLASGVFAYKGNVYATIIPNLYKLKDTDGDGKADTRKVLSTGYGVRYAYLGHDLHGMVMGPDGKLYFSIGDRAASAEAVDGSLAISTESGSVFRCNLDGTELEIFATGLRNPQELRFDKYGNLFTGDNNPDKGDPARWVYVVEGGDTGWRIGYQHGEKPRDGGPWTAEQIFQTAEFNNANYIVPHIAHAGAGPSGLAYYNGVGLPDKYNDTFFMCDYRGQAVTSGIWAFKVKPKGASFELTSVDGKPITRDTKIQDASIFYGTGVVDVDQGPDGSLYVADWTQGWDRPFRGRIYRVVDEDKSDNPLVLETKQLIAQGMEGRPAEQLLKLLAHPDMRVRQEAQFALAAKGVESIAGLTTAAKSNPSLLARLHAIWGLGQIARKAPDALKDVAGLLADSDLEVRCQAARVLGDARTAGAYDLLAKLAADPEPRARYFAVMALGKLGKKEATPALLSILKDNADKDGVLRFGTVWALAKLGDDSALAALAMHDSVSVRLGATLALRRMESPKIAAFLGDADRIVVLEAARAINDLPIVDALPALAGLADKPINKTKGFAEKAKGTGPGPQGDVADWILWRATNAAFRLGTPASAKQLATIASRTDVAADIRVEALHGLTEWAKPGNRDRITNLFRIIGPRDAAPAREAAKAIVDKLADDKSNPVKVAAAKLAQKYGLGDPAVLAKISLDGKSPADVRLAALGTLIEQKDGKVAELIEKLQKDADAQVRQSTIRLLGTQPKGAETLTAIAAQGKAIGDIKAAIDGLGDAPEGTADQTLADWMARLIDGKAQPEVALELLEAAGKRKDAKVAAALKQYNDRRKTDDPLAQYRQTLAGGDAAAGQKVFAENAAVSCIRCHAVNNEGGIVGPALDGIGLKQPREYLLASVVTPNAAVAPGFESLIVQTTANKYKTGIVKKDDDKELVLLDAENNLITIPKGEVKSRERGPSAMPEGLHAALSKRDLRNLVEWLASLKTPANGTSLDHGSK